MVYNYTKPRCPITASFNSPGPCYGLPSLVGHQQHDPRSVHSRGPAYPFGLALNSGSASDGLRIPGPANYAPDPKVHRNGRDGTPSFSLQSRHDDLSSAHLRATPGPGTYAPENAGPSARRIVTPSFSFGGRHRCRSTSDLPGPNKYLVPTLIGQSVQSGKPKAPAFSISGRNAAGSFHVDHRQTPGPGAYGVTDPAIYKSRPPMHSLSGRHDPVTDSGPKPGPGSHSPERVWNHKRQSPCFSFGIRHSQYVTPLIVNDTAGD